MPGIYLDTCLALHSLMIVLSSGSEPFTSHHDMFGVHLHLSGLLSEGTPSPSASGITFPVTPHAADWR